MFIKRLMFLGLSAVVTALVVQMVRRLTALAFTQATGVTPPED